jgi:hypothetical protein
MTTAEISQFRKAIEDTFLALYIVDVGSLTADQRKTHQELLGATYLALVRIENKAFNTLTASALQKLPALSASTIQLQSQLAGLKKATETLQLVAGALDVITSIARLFK